MRFDESSGVLSLSVDESSSDLTLEFSDGQVVRSFASSAFDVPAWTCRNVPQGLAVDVAPGGIEARGLKKNHKCGEFCYIQYGPARERGKHVAGAGACSSVRGGRRAR